MVGIADIYRAREVLRGVTHVTPLFTSRSLDGLVPARLYLKAENLQRTGSFKLRGAYNLLASGSFPHGVVTASSGNHGAAVAYAATRLNLRARVVVPVDAPAAKVSAARDYGAEVEPWGHTSLERQARAEELAREYGLAYVHSYDDPRIIAGQGTIFLELLAALPDLDVVVAPVGGGGLISGLAVACKALTPHVRVVAVEPEGADRMTRSLAAGARTEVPEVNTIADGMRVKLPGELTFECVRRYVDEVVTVSDQEIITALRLLWQRCKLVVEPSGAAALGAVVAQKGGVKGQAAVVLSGGNADLAQVAALLA
jgi:threonine dehydratase